MNLESATCNTTKKGHNRIEEELKVDSQLIVSIYRNAKRAEY